LYKEQVTAFIGTVGVRIGGSAALVTMGDDIGGNALRQALVKNKILSDK
jgi:hypothetical protein